MHYRMLNVGELIRDGDEFICNGEWVPSVNAGLGILVGAKQMYRRLETEDQQRKYHIPAWEDDGED